MARGEREPPAHPRGGRVVHDGPDAAAAPRARRERALPRGARAARLVSPRPALGCSDSEDARAVALSLSSPGQLRAALARLERRIAPHREPSAAYCVNRQTVFRPHVDKGGDGTSGQRGLSLIVGLGDYAGGALGVEDAVHDIRYRPLEFDGYTQRHYSEEFEGERFSVVWFSSRRLAGSE